VQSKALYLVIVILFQVLTVGSALVVVFSRNLVRAAFALFFTLCGVAAIYAALGADFLAAIQLLIYVGGILILILFAVMLSRRISQVNLSNPSVSRLVGGLVSLAVFAVLVVVIFMADWRQLDMSREAIRPTTRSIGASLLGRYLLAFELASVVLVAALIGAVYVARQRRTRVEELEEEQEEEG
jgi:NADH-quinone oxidoreductase subunit J